MKNYFNLVLFSSLIFTLISCENVDISSPQGEELIDKTEEFQKNMFVFKDWNAFYSKYQDFSKLETNQLEENSFFSSTDYTDNLSLALQGILNDERKFKVGESIILLKNNKFYKSIEGVKTNSLEEIGSISFEKVKNVSDAGLKTVPIANQKEFRKQRYVSRCGSGNVQGTSPRPFKYVHETFAETFNFNGIYYYYLHLRVKLEYNSKRKKWRLSGENREIDINITNRSRLRDILGRPIPIGDEIGGYPSEGVSSIRWSSSCASHQERLLTGYINVINGIPNNKGWEVNVSGTITEKMFGDVESNRWRDSINW